MRYSAAIMQQVNWDNLRYVLMVAEKGSIAAAARELGVNRTTVLRRINIFQDNLSCRIFERGERGYILTPEAEKMIDAAREVESTIFNMQRQIAGRDCVRIRALPVPVPPPKFGPVQLLCAPRLRAPDLSFLSLFCSVFMFCAGSLAVQRASLLILPPRQPAHLPAVDSAAVAVMVQL